MGQNATEATWDEGFDDNNSAKKYIIAFKLVDFHEVQFSSGYEDKLIVDGKRIRFPSDIAGTKVWNFKLDRTECRFSFRKVNTFKRARLRSLEILTHEMELKVNNHMLWSYSPQVLVREIL